MRVEAPRRPTRRRWGFLLLGIALALVVVGGANFLDLRRPDPDPAPTPPSVEATDSPEVVLFEVTALPLPPRPATVFWGHELDPEDEELTESEFVRELEVVPPATLTLQVVREGQSGYLYCAVKKRRGEILDDQQPEDGFDCDITVTLE